ncbi:MAG: hypothetical protein MUF78_03765 [Candidatus Edwardsbacteria bacterium]|jgi:hypothetical protein|nr:hypothetical protein [Candidatus Edwardsbacteria bacterium]
MTVRAIIPLALCLAATLAAQPRPALDALVEAYERGDYRRVAAIAESAAADTTALSADDRAYLLTYWAFSLVALSREDDAVARFRQLLELRPATELNPEFVSPKIIGVFRQAQAQHRRADAPSDGITLQVEDRAPSKPGALLRTMAWPGWGQSYRGQARKGRILRIAALAAAAALGATEVGCYVTHQQYLDARDADRIADTYTTYNRWYRSRALAVNLAVSVWVAGVIDVMMDD